MDKGYSIDHAVALITLFSAPDSPQFQATEDRNLNKGANIVLGPPNFDTPDFHTFDAVTSRSKVNPYYDCENVVDPEWRNETRRLWLHESLKFGLNIDVLSFDR